jgi:hypothetical protein
MKNERKHYTAEEKVAILRRHLLDKVPVSELCEPHTCRVDFSQFVDCEFVGGFWVMGLVFQCFSQSGFCASVVSFLEVGVSHLKILSNFKSASDGRSLFPEAEQLLIQSRQTGVSLSATRVIGDFRFVTLPRKTSGVWYCHVRRRRRQRGRRLPKWRRRLR